MFCAVLGAYLGTFTFFYFPVEVLGIIENICDFSAQQWYLDGFVSVKVWLVVLGYSSSAFNPILYGLSTNAWRQAILACLRCKRLKQCVSHRQVSALMQYLVLAMYIKVLNFRKVKKIKSYSIMILVIIIFRAGKKRIRTA